MSINVSNHLRIIMSLVLTVTDAYSALKWRKQQNHCILFIILASVNFCVYVTTRFDYLLIENDFSQNIYCDIIETVINLSSLYLSSLALKKKKPQSSSIFWYFLVISWINLSHKSVYSITKFGNLNWSTVYDLSHWFHSENWINEIIKQFSILSR